MSMSANESHLPNPTADSSTNADKVQPISYEAPAIIYEGKITSRAGSPIPDAPTPPDQGDGAIDLFPND